MESSSKLAMPELKDASVSQMEMVDLLKQFVILQDQFRQLTHYIEEAFKRIESLNKIVQNKVLS